MPTTDAKLDESVLDKSRVDIDRLIVAAQDIEKIVQASKDKTASLKELAKKARAGTLTPEERHQSYMAERTPVITSLDDAINELIGALHSRPATY